MRKSFLFITALVLAAASQSFAQSYKYAELNNYELTAKNLLTVTQGMKADSNVESAIIGTRQLVGEGVAIMSLYAEKNPACAEQFAIMMLEVSEIEAMTLEAADARYHDGVGLPAAPKHCYFGRSQVIHPAMNLIRLKGQITAEVKESMVEELEEVIHHLARIQKNLDNPPVQ